MPNPMMHGLAMAATGGGDRAKSPFGRGKRKKKKGRKGKARKAYKGNAFLDVVGRSPGK